jgi:Family of unknown function (DUF6502)
MSLAQKQDHSKIMIESLRRLLRRLVKLAMSFGITYPTLEALVKRSYLECAEQAERAQGKPLTDSRISLLTGVARSELRRLRATAGSDESLPRSVPVRVAMRWWSPPYIDRHGRAKPLPRLASVGGAVSFEGLVAEVSTDIRAAALLADWVESGVARIDGKDRVNLDVLAYCSRVDRQEQAAINLAYTVGDLIEAHTLSATKRTPKKHRWAQYVYFTHLTAESVQTLNEKTERMLDACVELNHFGSQLELDDRANPAARYRYLVCTYRFNADMAVDPPVPLLG